MGARGRDERKTVYDEIENVVTNWEGPAIERARCFFTFAVIAVAILRGKCQCIQACQLSQFDL